MPWFPDFIGAMELARQQTRAAGQADPVAQYLTALNKGDAHLLEDAWPGEVVVYDPRAGEVRGHRQLRRFVSRNLSWLAGLHARTETVARTVADGRAVVELLAHLDHNERELAWPVAVVAESPDDLSVVFRTYCSQWPVDERRHLRPPLLGPRRARPGDVVGRYQDGLMATWSWFPRLAPLTSRSPLADRRAGPRAPGPGACCLNGPHSTPLPNGGTHHDHHRHRRTTPGPGEGLGAHLPVSPAAVKSPTTGREGSPGGPTSLRGCFLTRCHCLGC